MQPACSTAATAPIVDRNTLFHDHITWVKNLARKAVRLLPPSFETDDLVQAGLIEHWKRTAMFDPSKGVPYRAYAYLSVYGAMLMQCRRRAYRDATCDELEPHNPAHNTVAVDDRLRADQAMLAAEEEQRVAGSTLYLRRLRVLMALRVLSPEDADLVRQVLAGADVIEMAQSTPGIRRRFSQAIQKLRRELNRSSKPKEKLKTRLGAGSDGATIGDVKASDRTRPRAAA